MQAFHAERFDREIGCSERDWLAQLPQAIGGHPYEQVAQALTARIGDGQLALSWRLLQPSRATAGARSRLLVSFRFQGLDDIARYRFMKRFDLVMQRAVS